MSSLSLLAHMGSPLARRMRSLLCCQPPPLCPATPLWFVPSERTKLHDTLGSWRAGPWVIGVLCRPPAPPLATPLGGCQNGAGGAVRALAGGAPPDSQGAAPTSTTIYRPARDIGCHLRRGAGRSLRSYRPRGWTAPKARHGALRRVCQEAFPHLIFPHPPVIGATCFVCSTAVGKRRRTPVSSPRACVGPCSLIPLNP